nr:hypothetical protein [Akkermansiaceae bacterium]
MKHKFHNLLLAGLLVFAAGSLQAQTSMVPSAMNYQGMLTDANGDPVANAAPENRNVEFRIYSQASGGTPLWGEAQTVTVYRGHFSIVLGNGTAVGGAPSGPASFAAVFANAASADLYFGITPQGGAEFAPRQKLLSSAFALRARVAENVTQIGTTSNSLNNLTLNGDFTQASGFLRLNGTTKMKFGNGLAGSTTNSGLFEASSGMMNIAGVSNNGNDSSRRITMWAEGGTDFAGPISFGSRQGQHVNLWSNTFGFGIQDNSLYARTAGNFHWFSGGAHNNSDGNAGSGGTRLATLNTSGLTLTSGVFTGNGSGLTNINPSSLPNNYNYLGINGNNVIEFGRGVSKAATNGQIGYGTHSSGAALDIVGAGTQSNYSDRKINLHTQGGLTVFGGATVDGNLRTNGWTEAFGPIYAKNSVVIEGSGKLNFATPERTGQHINLWGNSYGIGVGAFTLYQRSASAFKWYVGGTHDDGGPGAGGQVIADWTNDRFDFNRRVYIGANTGSGTAPLEVNGGTSTQTLSSIARFYRTSGGGTGYDNSST